MENKKIKGAVPTEAYGYKFRSKLESRVAKELMDNNISFEYEKLRFEIIPSFSYNEQSYRAVHYTPDFICGNYIIECKGFPNDSWALKKKVIIKYLISSQSSYKFFEVHNLKELKPIINMIKYNMEEIWKPIEEFPEYEISNFGEVSSHKGKGRRTIKSFYNPEGYKFVYLYKDNKKHPVQVHRLVAKYFVPNPNNYEYINHKDEDKGNNICSNLEWCTSSYNRTYGTTEKRRIESLADKYAIDQYSLEGKFIKTFRNAREASMIFGKTNASSINNCVRGVTKSAYGFKWKRHEQSSRKNERSGELSSQQG